MTVGVMGVLTIILYFPTTGFDFIHLDDYSYVVNNPLVQNGLSLNNIVNAFGVFLSSNWHPVTWLSHMLDCELFGMHAGAHHMVNVLIHAANGLLLFIVLKQMTGAYWRSFFVAALFAWHPLHVESVAWVSERKDVLCCFFWLLTLWSYARYVLGNRNGFYLLSLLFAILALMAKPMAVTLPFVLLLLDVWPLQRLKPAEPGVSMVQQVRKLLIEKLPVFVFVAFTCLQTWLAQSQTGNIKNLEYLSLWPRICNSLIAYVNYLWMMVWPTDLAIIYPHPHQVRLSTAIFSTALLLLITAWTLWRRKKQPYLLFGWLWYLGTLVPVIGLVQVGMQALADRYTYIPLIGIFIMIAWVLYDIVKQSDFLRRPIVIICGISLLACLTLTRIQIYRWKDSETLFTHTVAVTENNWLAHAALGNSYFMKEKYTDAKKQFIKAVHFKSNDTFSFWNLGRTYMMLGEHEKAVEQFENALRINSDCVEAYYHLGRLYETTNRPQSALVQYQKAHERKPKLYQPVTRMIWILSTHPDSQIRDGRQALGLAEKFRDAPRPPTEFLCSLAAAYAETGQFSQAVNHAERTLKAIKNSSDKEDTELSKILEASLKLYKNQHPYRSEQVILPPNSQ
ncbi:MAG: tetratricopeptide repeat protein [Planctomycetota bacterium]